MKTGAIVVIGVAMPLLIATPARAQTRDQPLQVEALEVYRIGGMDAPAWASLTDVRDVAFGPSGELWIVDSRGARILRVAADGRSGEDHLRRGGGPGEFQLPGGVAVLGDGRVLFGDVVNATLQLFGADGRFIAGARKHPSLRSADMAWLDGQDFVAVPQLYFVDGEARISGPQGTTAVTSVPLLRVTFARELDVRTIADAAYVQPPKTTVRFASHAFQPAVHWSVQRGRIALVDGVDYDVRLLDADGRDVGRLRRPIPARSPTRADRDAARQVARSRLIAPGGTPLVAGAAEASASGGARNAPALLRSIEAGLAAMTFAERIPVITGIRYDAAGRLWVARTPDVWGQPPLLDVFSPAGEYVGTTRAVPRLPDAFGPDGLAAWIEKDGFDVPYVRVIRLRLPR
jgi:hypothetical protein